MRASALVLACLLPLSAALAAPGEAQRGEMSGYLIVPIEQVPRTYNQGFSMYVAAWPLLQEYPGHNFQSGLFGTWMFAQQEPGTGKVPYSDIEGGLGWWRDTRFPTETPKFIMGGVGPDFSVVANGPAHGWGSWEKPRGVYGVAQLSPWLLFPIDGLNVKQGACGGLFGYGYLPLPLTKAKPTTEGKDVPTGDNCWTLFLNTGNFKGPVCFFTPNFWSKAATTNPKLAGLLLDTRPADPNRAMQMETQWIPAAQAVDNQGQTWARIAPVSFPRSADGSTVCVHRITSYNRSALRDAVQAWFDGGPAVSGEVNPQGAYLHRFTGTAGSTWRIFLPKTPNAERVVTPWKYFATPQATDPHTFGYRWDYTLASKTDTADGPLVTVPEYYRLVKGADGKPKEWEPVRATEVPAETGLIGVNLGRVREARQQPYTTPEDPQSCWRKPGPKAGPFTAKLGDGSVVTYSWYRFADQPALLNADLTEAEREAMQKRVELLHRHWTKDRNYLTPPATGSLADLDPAQLVTPPPGLEIGYVPIATRQAAGE